MARLIDADELEKKLCEDCIGDRVCERRCYEVTLIRSMPTVDAVEVVRCKDCVYCKRFNDVYQLPKLDVLICRYCCDEDEVTENDFCSWGERKDEVEE